jgi:tyrosyl-tRNA synthetase
MLQREDFRERLEKEEPIHAHEIQYPIMQGWDSVKIRADVEIGGTDQLFNILVGRDLQKEEGQDQQVALLVPILEGTDGVRKMSKSYGNHVGVDEPPGEMFGKVMSIPDEAMEKYYLLLLGRELPVGHPMDVKKELGHAIVARYHSPADADDALEDFNVRFSRKELGRAELPSFDPRDSEADIVSVVVAAYQVAFDQKRSRGDARRLVEQGSIQLGGEKITDPKAAPQLEDGAILRLDKRRAVRIGL